MELARQQLLEIYENMVRSRAFEELVIELMPQWKIPASWMSGIGQEGIVGALCTLLEGDYVTYTHRGAYYFITRGSDPRRLLAELYGKRTGYCRGKGGRHIADTAHKLFGKSGTIGGHAPLAVGMATAVQIRGDDAVVMSFFGDGASNRGTTHESMNLSALWKLPLVWVCENNAWAGTTPVSLGTAVTDIADRAGSYAMPGTSVDGNDVLAYTVLNFAGIELVSEPQDVSAMTHFRLDVWAPEGAEFKVKLVDFGADGAFSGGDDVDHELTFDETTTPAFTAGAWCSLDIPVADFTGLVTKEHLAQLVISSDDVATVFVDNVYFHR